MVICISAGKALVVFIDQIQNLKKMILHKITQGLDIAPTLCVRAD